MDPKHLDIIIKAKRSPGKLEGKEHQFIDRLYKLQADSKLDPSDIPSLESIGRRIGLLEKNEIDKRIDATNNRKRSMGSGRRGRY